MDLMRNLVVGMYVIIAILVVVASNFKEENGFMITFFTLNINAIWKDIEI